jgi:hypothetical protein
MDTRFDFIKAIINENRDFSDCKDEILNLLISADYVIELVKAAPHEFITFQIIEQGYEFLQKLFTTPQQYYSLYHANTNLAEVFFSQSRKHFKTVFKDLDDITELALLDPGSALSVISVKKIQHAKVNELLFTLAAKQCPVNLCILILNCIPVKNISKPEFDKLVLIMTNNPSIEKIYIDSWKDKYYSYNYDFSFQFFVKQTLKNISGACQTVTANPKLSNSNSNSKS